MDRGPSLSLRRLIAAGVQHSWRVSLAVAAGVAVATAVIVGALLVGDSMRGSLRGLTLERLGKTQAALLPGGFFDADSVTRPGAPAVAILLFDRGVAETRAGSGALRRAGTVQIIGCDDDFWSLGAGDPEPPVPLDGDSVVLNQQTASELNVRAGDEITLRLPVEQAVPADSPLGRRDTLSQALPRMKVASIIPDAGLGRFSLTPSQATPLNIFISRQTIAEALDRPNQANVVLLPDEITPAQLDLDLGDFGLSLRRVRQAFGGKTVFDYYTLTSDRLLLPDPAVQAIQRELGADQVTPVIAYLANAIERLDAAGNVAASVPYSIIAGVEPTAALPLDFQRPTAADAPTAAAPKAVPVVLNDWTAQRLSAEAGTPLRIAYYEPEVERGDPVERTFAAVVTAVVPITKPARPYQRNQPAQFDQSPTVYNDPDLTPLVPGVTDQDSINDWDLPFTLQREVTEDDDLYWNNYRLTPKAFVPFDAGQDLFSSRFGNVTSLRLASSLAADAEALERRLLEILTPRAGELGWEVVPVREMQLAASRGTTPFDGLFLSLSFFVILSAVLLISMLFRLGLLQRAGQFGALLSVGWSPRRAASLALGEGLSIAVLGVLAGLVLGVGYAWGVLWALRTWWVGAVTVPFLKFHWTSASLLIGGLSGWLVAALTLWVSVRWLSRSSARQLLSGQDPDATAWANRPLPEQVGKSPHRARRRAARWAWAIAIIAAAIVAYGATLGGQTAAGAFVGGGTLLLIAALLAIHNRLRRPARRAADPTITRYSLAAMSAGSVARHPLRSTMTIGLMAAAAFLIIAISAFQLRPSVAGTGGFDFIGQTAQPIYQDLSQHSVQNELLGSQAEKFRDAAIVPIRLKRGQDASCNNLYLATQPTVLGVPPQLPQAIAERQRLTGFQWVGGEPAWEQLETPAAGTQSDPIPMVIDQNTAMWSLQMMAGVGERRSFAYDPDRPIWFRVVGMLTNSVLQGKLIIGEENFERLFPEVSGYRYFLVSAADESSSELQTVLEDRLGDFGMDVSPADELLANLMAVQNTYLRTFQSLGGLGLVLGTFGLAIAQLRSLLERRGELAVLRAIGFTRRRLAWSVLIETAVLLLLGVGCGVVCAVVVVTPHAYLNGFRPPLLEPVLLMTAIVAVGLLAGLVAVVQVVKLPLLESLRSD